MQKRGQMVPSEGTPKYCRINSAKYGFPLRSDVKMDVIRVINDIEVEDESKTPFLNMRYPYEDGELHQNLQAERIAWYMARFGFEEQKALEWTEAEFTALFSTSDALVNTNDPCDIIAKLLQLELVLTEANQKEILKATKNFFTKTQKELILLTPMKTYPKSKYHFGMHIDSLRDKEWPEAVSYWTANGENLSNILSQCNLPGNFTFEDEQRIIQAEKSYLRVASEYGESAQILRQDHLGGFTDYLHQRMDNPEGQRRPERLRKRRIERPLHHRGRISSSEESSSDASTSPGARFDDVRSTDNETIIGSEYNQPRLSLDPKDALPPPKVGFLLCVLIV